MMMRYRIVHDACVFFVYMKPSFSFGIDNLKNVYLIISESINIDGITNGLDYYYVHFNWSFYFDTWYKLCAL